MCLSLTLSLCFSGYVSVALSLWHCLCVSLSLYLSLASGIAAAADQSTCIGLYYYVNVGLVMVFGSLH